MLSDTLSVLLSFVIATNASLGISRSKREQDDSFNTKLVNLTLSEIARRGPNAEIAALVSHSITLFWPKRDELESTTAPYIEPQDTTKTSAALDIFYRLRAHHPMSGLGFNEDQWQKENGEFFNKLDAVVYGRLDHLLLSQDASLLDNLAFYLGISRSSAAKAALLQLANNPKVAEQALICLGWHKDPKDMDDLMPFMLKGGREAASLPYVFRNSYGAVAAPYLRKAMAQAFSPFTRLQAAFELIHLDDQTGVRYLVEAVRDREKLHNGRAQAGEIMQFAWNYMGFHRRPPNMDELLEFLKSKL